MSKALISDEAIQRALADEKAAKKPLSERQKRLVEAATNYQQLRADEEERRRKLKAEGKPLGGRTKTIGLIQEAAGYPDTHAGKALVWDDLNRPHVLLAILKRTRSKLTLGAVLASDTVIDLASDAKSEKVRLEAASKLLDMHGIGQQAQQGGGQAGGLTINIDLGGENSKAIDVTPEAKE